MDARKIFLDPFVSLRKFRCITALAEEQEKISYLYNVAHPSLSELSTIIDVILISAETSDAEALHACRSVIETIRADELLPKADAYLMLAACNYAIAKLTADCKKFPLAERALETAFDCLHHYELLQHQNRPAWHNPRYEYLQYCLHRLRGVVCLSNKEYLKAERAFRAASGFCVPPHITSGAAILQSYLGLIHVILGDVHAGFVILGNAERMFDATNRDTSLDWIRHRFNFGCAYKVAHAPEKALIEFETVLHRLTVLFNPESEFIYLEMEAVYCMRETHQAIAQVAVELNDHEKAAHHLAEISLYHEDNDASFEDLEGDLLFGVQQMEWEPLPRGYIVIPNPAFNVDFNFFEDDPAEPDQNENIFANPRNMRT